MAIASLSAISARTLATELGEEEIGLRVSVRRLRYKDGRNMAVRGATPPDAARHGSM